MDERKMTKEEFVRAATKDKKAREQARYDVAAYMNKSYEENMKRRRHRSKR